MSNFNTFAFSITFAFVVSFQWDSSALWMKAYARKSESWYKRANFALSELWFVLLSDNKARISWLFLRIEYFLTSTTPASLQN
jgi:hypothetical protein